MTHASGRRAALAALVVSAAFLVPAAPSVAADPTSLFGETLDVDVVNVEVVVTDRDGEPVSGLLRSDFEVFEDGVPVEITNFHVVDRRRAGGMGATAGPALDELPADATRRLHLVVLVDRAGLRIENRTALLASLDGALDRAFELEGQVMLATVDAGVEVHVPFTRDVDAVRTALDRLTKEVAPTALDADRRLVLQSIDRVRLVSYDPMDPYPFETAVSEAERLTVDLQQLAEKEVRRVERTVTVLGGLLDSIAGLPGRKAVLFLSDGLPDRVGDGFAETWRGKFQSWLDENRLGVPHQVDAQILRNLSGLESSRYDTRREVTELGQRAAAHRVTFYPVARAGHTGLSAASRTSNRGAAVMEAFGRESSLMQVAEATGGRAWLNNANLDATLDHLALDSESYYSLGYEPPGARGDGTFHEVEVKVRRDGVKVRHARGYQEKDAATRLREATLAALHHGGGANPLALRLETGEPEPAPDDDKRLLLPLRVYIPYRGLLLLPDAESHRAALRLVLVVRDVASGATSEPQEMDLPVRIPNDRLGEALSGIAVFPIQLNAGQGAKQIAVGIRDQLARVDSTSRLEVTIGGS